MGTLSGANKDYLRKLVADIVESVGIVSEYVSKPYESLKRPEKSEIRYYLILLAEALSAMAYHITRREFSATPQTPTEALTLLAERNLLTKDELNDILRLVRLRNLLVHRYWAVDDRRIHGEAGGYFKSVLNFVKRVRELYGI